MVVLHGGPGGGSQADYRRYFDPSSYLIVQMDQRGCSRSTPHAELEDNNTQALVKDIETLRMHLKISECTVNVHVYSYHLGNNSVSYKEIVDKQNFAYHF